MNKLKSLRGRHAHFLLLAFYSCLFFYNRNGDHFPDSPIWPALRIALGAAIVLGAFSILVWKKTELGALVGFGLNFLFFTFGHWIYLLAAWVPFALGAAEQGIILIFGLLLIVWSGFFLNRKGYGLRTINRYVTVLFLFLGIYQLFLFWGKEGAAKPETAESIVAVRRETAGLRPNLYVIVLDAYAREDSLRKFFDYDNGEFLKEIEDLGFQTAEKSVASYFLSALSMSAMFNMDYIQNLDLAKPRTFFDLMPANEKLDRSKARALLRPLGYQFVATASLFPPIECRGADVFVRNSLSFDNMLANYLDTTALRPFSSEHGKYRNFVLKNLEMIPGLARGHEPAFVYAHITLPHPPFVFTAEGNPCGDDRTMSFNDGHEFFLSGASREDYAKGYLEQVRFLNRRVPALLERILREDPSDPYVILMSDHGPRLLYGDRKKTAEELRLTCANLLALRTPKGVKVPEGALSGPINLMRFVVGRMTGEDLPLLPVHVYLSYGDAPYAFEEVTEKVRGN